MKKVVIIGAGVSGVYLSILLKQRMPFLDVTILEQNASPLKKLLATGNGRCNLSNRHMSIQNYMSDRQDIVEDIISSFDMQKEMEKIGLLCHYQGDLLYPRSEQALSVQKIFMDQAHQLGVRFEYSQEVNKIKCQNQYIIATQNHHYQADILIFATGSEAGKLSGIQMARYDMLKDLKLQVIPSFPSLVQIKTRPILKQLKGVRIKGTFSLLENNQCIHQEKGELLFTDYGVSGIAVMQLSAFYQKGHQYEISIDMFDEMSEKELYHLIQYRQQQNYPYFYEGLVHTKIASYLEKLNLQKTEDIVHIFKDMRLQVTGVRSYENAQVMKGGLSLQDVDTSLQVCRYPHMYAIGEILNVAGLCGGYNLHFALSSALRVAQSIERDYYAENS